MLLGEVVSLMLASNLHRDYLVNDIGSVFLPPIDWNQFRIYHQGERPIAFVSWAWLSEEVEHAYLHSDRNLTPNDWNSGSNGWIIDFIAPFGHATKIVSDLRTLIFPNVRGKAMRVKENGHVKGLIKLHGINA